jgi:integrase
MSLREAGIKRDDARKLRDNNIDPIIARGPRRPFAAASSTVDQAAEVYVVVMEKEWKTKRYASQVRARLETYVKPIIGHLPIADIGLAEIKQVLVPIWTNKRPTANRVRKHLEGAVNWAIAEGHRTDESNPAEVKRLQFSLSFAERKVTHYPSLPYSEAASFLAELRKQDGVKARALEFVMLTAVRVADICGGGKEHAVPMLWQHVDMPGRSWTIPDTKTGTHVVPLSDPALMLLVGMQAACDPTTDFVFPGAKRGTAINAATLRVLLQDMGFASVATTHGFRATFRTWASETTAFDKDVIETCLAHAQGKLEFGLPPWVFSRQAPSLDGCVGRLLR